MRRLVVAAMLCAAGCAAGDEAMHVRTPDWSGPPLSVASRADGSLQLELQAPTAGHAFELRSVTTAEGTADVQLLHRTPGDAIVAQVVTPLPLAVPADRLGACRQVRLWVTTREGTDDHTEPPAALAFVLLRPEPR